MRGFREAAASIVRGGSPELPLGLAEFVRSVLDLDAALQLGFTVTLADVTPLEFKALIVLREQRAVADQARQQMAASVAAKQRAPQGF
jgi:hypothetical protein